MQPTLNRIVLYVKDVPKTCAFHERHFGFARKVDPDDRIIELVSPHGGAIIMVHQAGRAVKSGQMTVKLVFDIRDVEAFKAQCAKNGLQFGATHRADGYTFANAKDPNGNSISISSRSFASSR